MVDKDLNLNCGHVDESAYFNNRLLVQTIEYIKKLLATREFQRFMPIFDCTDLITSVLTAKDCPTSGNKGLFA